MWMLSQVTLKSLAAKVGLDDCAAVPVHRQSETADFMERWLAGGLHGNMAYLERNRDKRYDPSLLVEDAQTVVVALLTYAHSGHDYHRAMKSKLYELENLLVLGGYCTFLETQNKFCDSAPFLERCWAVEANLGFIGKNHQLIHPTLGSYVHIGELVLTVPVQPPQEEARIKDGCGSCVQCVDACPGNALGQPLWDARKCVAYVTHKCTICQQVCPLNKHVQ